MSLSIGEIRKLEIEHCAKDVEYFIDKYGHIEDKNNPEEMMQPFKMWQAQRDCLKSVMSHRLNAILKARQLGISWLAEHIASWQIGTHAGHTVIALSKTEEEAKEIVRRCAVILRWANELFAEKNREPNGWVGPVFTATALSIEITWPGTPLISKLQALASSPGAGRSFTANLVIMDEWAFQQFAEEIWEGAFPTINSPEGGRFIGLSTIKRGSLFEEIFTNPDNGFNKVFIPWYADPRRDEEWYRRTKLALGDAMTAEYPATIEEALTVPGGSFFPEVTRKTHETSLEVYENMLKGNVKRFCHLDYGLDMLSAHWTIVDSYKRSITYRECDESDLTIGQAAEMLLARSADEHIDAWLAPPDLWNRQRETGKSTADTFAEHGIHLIKVSNDLFNGCLQLKELLKVDEETGKCNHQFLEDTCPNAIRCLQKIQKDKTKPSVYAKNPHNLTHDVDSMRYFAVWWVTPAQKEQKVKKKWSQDLIEDWKNAGKEMRELMRQKFGEPQL